MDSKFNTKPYKNSRIAYTIQCAAEYLATLLVADAFLAKLLKSLGFSDAVTGVISSLISLAFLMQLFSIPIMRTLKNVKSFVVITDTISMLLYMSAYIVPFVPVGDTLRKIMIFICIAGGFFGRYISFNMYYGWANSYVDPEKRGTFTAVKETVSLASGIAMSLVMGFVYDYFEARNNLPAAFIVTAAFIALLSAASFAMILCIKKRDAEEEKKQRMKLSEVAAVTFRSKPFRRVLFLQCMVRFATYLTIGFLGTYKTVELGFSISTAQILVTCGLIAWMFVSVPFGIFSDKYTFAGGYVLGCAVAFLGFASLVFTAPSTAMLMIAYTILYNMSQAGIGANASNMVYSYVPNECFSQAQAIMSSISGLCGFVASLLGGKILSAVQKNGFKLFGTELYGQQVLALISAVIILVGIIYALVAILPKNKNR